MREIETATELRNRIQVQKFNQQKEEINTLLSSILTKCKTRLEEMELTEEERKLLEIISLIEQVKIKVKDISKLSSELADYRKFYELAEKIYSTFSQVKKQKVQEIYHSIQGDIQRFYSLLHPNEPHRNIELIVALGKRASTELKIESFGQKEDPRALTSEGHLDSLGLCIFLAFVKKFNESCSLIVLDDVVTTVDARHRENICKLLIEEFGDKQLIITTHDGVWYEQLRAAQRAYGVEGNFKNLSIVDWSVDTGPIIRPYKPRWERIQEKIVSGDKIGAGNEGRQYLEWLLERICELTQAPVPFKSSGRYTVGDLYDPAKKRVKELIKDEQFKAHVFERFKNLDLMIIMGNLLSHNNILAENVSIDEVESFCNRVKELHEAFLCPECGRFINYYRDLKILRCSNSRCEKPIEVKTK
jgi:flagellin-specific chaperone FliS